MKSLTDQNYYEILEIPRRASTEEIERAYRLVRATYVQGSLAGHSVFEDGDAEVIGERVELAYRTLSDPEKRASYDASMEHAQTPQRAAETAATQRVHTPEPPLDPLDAFDDLDESEGEFNGARLRRARLRRGVELDEIAGVTKVSPTYLEFLEQERFGDLPAAVYVRGFVMGYAQCIGLDPPAVASSYMKRYDESQGQGKRGLFSRR